MTVDREALTAFLAGALDYTFERARSLADEALRQAERSGLDERQRTWIGEAIAAFDQHLATLGEGAAFEPDVWIARAQAAATIASAEQARLANLIAWKQLQATRTASSDAGAAHALVGAADAVTDEIDRGLGIA